MQISSQEIDASFSPLPFPSYLSVLAAPIYLQNLYVFSWKKNDASPRVLLCITVLAISYILFPSVKHLYFLISPWVKAPFKMYQSKLNLFGTFPHELPQSTIPPGFVSIRTTCMTFCACLHILDNHPPYVEIVFDTNTVSIP